VLKASGAQLRRMLAYMLRDENLDGAHGEFYQLSRGLRVTYDRASRCFDCFELDGLPLPDDRVLRVGLQEYHYKNFESFFGLPMAQLADGKGVVAATSLLDVLEEYFAATHQPDAQVEGRLVVK